MHNRIWQCPLLHMKRKHNSMQLQAGFGCHQEKLAQKFKLVLIVQYVTQKSVQAHHWYSMNVLVTILLSAHSVFAL